MMPRKGQTSIEMIISIMFVLFILVIIALFASERNREAEQIKVRIDSKRVCMILADNINNIAGQGSGFYKYFSLPETLYGVTDYNISVYQDYVEISTDNYAWTVQTVSSNVTAHCLDTGAFKKNKVYVEEDRVHIICNRPELMILNGSMWPPYAYTNKSINLSVRVMNFGPVDAGSFNVSFNGTTKTVSSLGSEEEIEVFFSYNTTESPGEYPIGISVNAPYPESITINNFFNSTLNVVKED
jgi:hypothetical protein